MTLPRSFSLLLAVALGAVCASPSLLAQTTATTDPVGMIQINLPAGTDSYVYLPFKRTPVFAGTATAAPTPVGTGQAQIPLSGSPSITDTQSYYVFLVDGDTRSGMYYPVTAYDSSSVTIDLTGDTLPATAVVSGTRLQVIPFDTLGTIFPGGQGIVPSAGFGANSVMTQVFLPDPHSVGTGVNFSETFIYYNGTAAPAGWRNLSDLSTIADSTILYPDTFFMVRNTPAGGSTLNFTGTVAMSTLRVPLNILAANTDQDNLVALPIAAPITLSQTNLFESGAFTPSTNRGAGGRGDQIFVWDRGVSGTDLSASRTYYYLNVPVGNGNGPGWRLVGDEGNDTVRDTLVGDSIMGANSVIMIRKAAKSQSVGTTFWAVKPPYVP